ncbi:late secretory pathway protein AVL9-like [Cucumis melo var. makuwa]|uniref:Late secretory pathway protein AVL9-like n=1 Tax=Cucumis melo var. makuwa TaxID=1194695 RepID=A0A5A7UGH1_CUCMM|nr:late secretory pathway protein AVL9-like [Cucumis melo var. makuwa]
MNLARFEWGVTSLEGDKLSREANVGDEDDDILDLLTNLQGSKIARKEDFDDGDGFDDEFPEDVDEMDTSNVFKELMNEARNPFYPECTKFSSLNFLVKLMHIKVLNNWSNKSFDMLLELLKDAF